MEKMEPVGFPGTEHARNYLRWNQHCAIAWPRQRQVNGTLGAVKKLPCPQPHLKRHFLLNRPQLQLWNLKSENSKTAFCNGSGEAVFTRTANNRRMRLSFISNKLGTASSVSEVLGTQQGCSCWDAAHHRCREAGHCFLAALSPPAQICRFSRLPSLPVLISVLGTARCHTGEVAHRHTGGPEGFYLFSPCGWESTQRHLLILYVQCCGEENRCGNYRWLQWYRVFQPAFWWKQGWFTLSGLTSLTIIFCFIIQRQTLKKHVANMPGSFRWKEVRTICVAFQRLVLVTSHGFRKLFF